VGVLPPGGCTFNPLFYFKEYYGKGNDIYLRKQPLSRIERSDRNNENRFCKVWRYFSKRQKIRKDILLQCSIGSDQKNIEAYKAQQRFFNSLKFVPNLICKLGRLEKRVIEIEHEGIAKILGRERVTFPVEKGVDINIAVDMLTSAYDNAYDVAILVSGDGDFAVAVEAVKKLNKPVECAFFKAKKCFHIQKVASRFIPLDKNYLLSCILPEEKNKIK